MNGRPSAAPRVARRGARIALVAAAVVLALAAVVVVDRLAGVVLPPSSLSGGLVLPPNARLLMRTSEFDCEVATNELGFRGGPLAPASPGRQRIVAIGDSFTYGWGVALEDSWPFLLEQELRGRGLDVDVLNLGRPGADPRSYADVAERALPVLEPSLVLVAVVQGDDLMQLPVDGASATSLAAPTASQRVSRWFPTLAALAASRTDGPGDGLWTGLRESFRDNAARVRASFDGEAARRYAEFDPEVKRLFEDGDLNPQLVGLSVLLPGYYLGPLRERGAVAAARAAVLRGSLERVRVAAEAHGAAALVLGVPSSFYVDPEAQRRLGKLGFEVDTAALRSDAPDRIVASAAGATGLPFVPATGAFRSDDRSEQLYFAWDNHFTPAGNRLFATEIAAAVEKALRDGSGS